MRPVSPCRTTNRFAAGGRYASRDDAQGAAGHHTGTDFGSLWPVSIDRRLVRSVTPGIVQYSGFDGTLGNWVGVYYPKANLLVTYWHLSERLVSRGEWVQVYAPVGRVGNTGNSTAPHLHVQVNYGPTFDYHGHVNPWKAFRLFRWARARQIFWKTRGVHPNS